MFAEHFRESWVVEKKKESRGTGGGGGKIHSATRPRWGFNRRGKKKKAVPAEKGRRGSEETEILRPVEGGGFGTEGEKGGRSWRRQLAFLLQKESLPLPSNKKTVDVAEKKGRFAGTSL